MSSPQQQVRSLLCKNDIDDEVIFDFIVKSLECTDCNQIILNPTEQSSEMFVVNHPQHHLEWECDITSPPEFVNTRFRVACVYEEVNSLKTTE